MAQQATAPPHVNNRYFGADTLFVWAPENCSKQALAAIRGTRRRIKRNGKARRGGGRPISEVQLAKRGGEPGTGPHCRSPGKKPRSPGNAVTREKVWEPRCERHAIEMMERPPATDEELDFRHSHWWARRQRVIAGMRAAGLPAARIDRFCNCGADAYTWEDVDTGDVAIRANYCHDRWCDPCMRARALMIADNVHSQLKGRRFRHIVLTKKHEVSELGGQVTRLYAAFKKLRDKKLFLGRKHRSRRPPKHLIRSEVRRRRWRNRQQRTEFRWREWVNGGCAFLQCHVAENDGLWHVHFHLLASGRYLPQELLSRAWREVTGDSDNVHISEVDDCRAAALEVARYAAKPVDGFTTTDPESLAEIMRAANGRHLCFTFGDWRGFRLTKPIAPDPERRWQPIARLTTLIARAAGGDTWAIDLLSRIRQRGTPPTGPPHLFYRPDPLSTPTEAP